MKLVEHPTDKPVHISGGPMASCQVLIVGGRWNQNGSPSASLLASAGWASQKRLCLKRTFTDSFN